MCGIAGFIGHGNHDDIIKMSQAIRHRGPDAETYFEDPAAGIFLAHRRLAIVDIKGGAQPMWSADGNICVIFNGEIYNHRELRRELEIKGHRFTSDHADTEVLVHGFIEWGVNLPDRLNGMFAFCIYDRRSNQLFMARDRFGEKPFYYFHNKNLFAFASEATALIEHGDIDGSLDLQAVQKYFAYNFFPAPWTPYQGVKKLPAGCYAIYQINTDRFVVNCYWTFRIEPFETIPKNPLDAWAEEIESLLCAAVTTRLESDVPLGFLLSGGLDSSAILAAAAKAKPVDALKAFTIGFTEASYDEAEYAKIAANHVGAEHSLRTLPMTDAFNLMDDLLPRLDEPLGDSSILPTYMVCAFARESVTVALSGDGSDELFAGYDPFKALAKARAYKKIVPARIHKAVRLLANYIPRSDGNMSFDFKIRRTLRALGHREAVWNPMWMGALDPKDISELFNSPLDTDELYSEAIDIWGTSNTGSPVDRTLEFFTRLYLQDGILLKSDRASMLNSLELRAPFLDNNLVDFVRKIPSQYKFNGREGKLILKRAVRRLIPQEIIDRPKKGFGIPLDKWLRKMPAPSKKSPQLKGITTRNG